MNSPVLGQRRSGIRGEFSGGPPFSRGEMDNRLTQKNDFSRGFFDLFGQEIMTRLVSALTVEDIALNSVEVPNLVFLVRPGRCRLIPDPGHGVVKRGWLRFRMGWGGFLRTDHRLLHLRALTTAGQQTEKEKSEGKPTCLHKLSITGFG